MFSLENILEENEYPGWKEKIENCTQLCPQS